MNEGKKKLQTAFQASLMQRKRVGNRAKKQCPHKEALNNFLSGKFQRRKKKKGQIPASTTLPHDSCAGKVKEKSSGAGGLGSSWNGLEWFTKRS